MASMNSALADKILDEVAETGDIYRIVCGRHGVTKNSFFMWLLRNGSETQTALAITVDGDSVRLSTGQAAGGGSVELLVSQNLTHSQAPAGIAGTGSRVYRISKDGLQVDWGYTLTQAASLSSYYYPAQLGAAWVNSGTVRYDGGFALDGTYTPLLFADYAGDSFVNLGPSAGFAWTDSTSGYWTALSVLQAGWLTGGWDANNNGRKTNIWVNPGNVTNPGSSRQVKCYIPYLTSTTENVASGGRIGGTMMIRVGRASSLRSAMPRRGAQ